MSSQWWWSVVRVQSSYWDYEYITSMLLANSFSPLLYCLERYSYSNFTRMTRASQQKRLHESHTNNLHQPRGLINLCTYKHSADFWNLNGYICNRPLRLMCSRWWWKSITHKYIESVKYILNKEDSNFLPIHIKVFWVV